MQGAALGLEELFREVIAQAAVQRPGYPASLGTPVKNWSTLVPIREGETMPELARAIYSQVAGTRHQVTDQRLLDLVPGFRLLHVEELSRETASVAGMGFSHLLPLLADYSSDYICVSLVGVERIWSVEKESAEAELMSEAPDRFLETLVQFYKQKIYYLDKKGFLDYDGDKKAVLGAQMNPGAEYWIG